MSDLSQSLTLNVLGIQKDAPMQTIGKKSVPRIQSPVTLDELLIPKPASTVIFPVHAPATEYGLSQGDLLIVDRAATPADSQLVIVSSNDDLTISRFSQHSSNNETNLTYDTQNGSNSLPIWGVVTYFICKQ